MTDFLTPAQRSARMARIRASDTAPELAVRRGLHRQGFRFRLRRRDLPGRPDVVLARHEAVVLVHGCFWHRHRGCSIATIPRSNVQFWRDKFDANVRRDASVNRALRRLGWRVFTVWECQVSGVGRTRATMERLAKRIRG